MSNDWGLSGEYGAWRLESGVETDRIYHYLLVRYQKASLGEKYLMHDIPMHSDDHFSDRPVCLD